MCCDKGYRVIENSKGYFLKIIFTIEIYLIHNIVLLSGIQQSDSYIYIYNVFF